MEHGAVLRKDAVVHEERDLSGQTKVHDAAGIPFGVQEAGDEDVRVENDPQAAPSLIASSGDRPDTLAPPRRDNRCRGPTRRS
jgi:hypothetical protein